MGLMKTKGMALLWTMLFMVILLIIVGSFVTLTAKELKMGTGIDLSEAAYGAARSGIEVGQKNCPAAGTWNSPAINLAPNIQYTVTVTRSGAVCDIESTGVVSAGSLNNITRKLTGTYDPEYDAGNVVAIPAEVGAPGNGLYVYNNTVTHDYAISNFRDTKGIISSTNGNTNYAPFFQQFEISRPDNANTFGGTGTVAYAGTVGVLAQHNTLTPATSYWSLRKFFMAGIDGNGNVRIKYSTDGVNYVVPAAGTYPRVAPGAVGTGERLKFKITYNGQNFRVVVKNEAGDCYTDPIIIPFTNYYFNHFATSSYHTRWTAGTGAGLRSLSEPATQTINVARTAVGGRLYSMVLNNEAVTAIPNPELDVIASNFYHGNPANGSFSCAGGYYEEVTSPRINYRSGASMDYHIGVNGSWIHNSQRTGYSFLNGQVYTIECNTSYYDSANGANPSPNIYYAYRKKIFMLNDVPSITSAGTSIGTNVTTGNSVTLSANVTGDALRYNPTYTWNIAGPVNGSGSGNNLSYTFAQAGTYNVTVTYNDNVEANPAWAGYGDGVENKTASFSFTVVAHNPLNIPAGAIVTGVSGTWASLDNVKNAPNNVGAQLSMPDATHLSGELKIDLGSTYSGRNGFALNVMDNGGTAPNYRILVSNDNINWTTVKTWGTVPSWSEIRTYSTDPGNAIIRNGFRYIRIIYTCGGGAPKAMSVDSMRYYY